MMLLPLVGSKKRRVEFQIRLRGKNLERFLKKYASTFIVVKSSGDQGDAF